MRLVLSILLITFPFFALVLCGYVAVRRAMLPQAAIPGLNSFVLYFALPCMLYRFGASTPIAQLLDPSLVMVYALCAMLMVGLTVAFSRRGGRMGWNDAAFGALVAAFPNTGFMGVPLLVALLGAQAALASMARLGRCGWPCGACWSIRCLGRLRWVRWPRPWPLSCPSRS